MPLVDEDVFARFRCTLAVGGVAGLVALRLAEQREWREEDTLHRLGRLRWSPEMCELGEDHRQLKRGRVASLADLPIAREPEKRLEQHLGIERGPEREPGVQRLVLRLEDA